MRTTCNDPSIDQRRVSSLAHSKGKRIRPLANPAYGVEAIVFESIASRMMVRPKSGGMAAQDSTVGFRQQGAAKREL
jgi:hypothetical protein